jgi:hypothetical protein
LAQDGTGFSFRRQGTNPSKVAYRADSRSLPCGHEWGALARCVHLLPRPSTRPRRTWPCRRGEAEAFEGFPNPAPSHSRAGFSRPSGCHDRVSQRVYDSARSPSFLDEFLLQGSETRPFLRSLGRGSRQRQRREKKAPGGGDWFVADFGVSQAVQSL